MFLRKFRILCILVSGLFLLDCSGDEKEEAAMSDEIRAGSTAIEMLLEGAPAGAQLISSASGLQHLDIQVGEGDPPKPGQMCSTHATLWLLDGTRVWSSRDPGSDGQAQPFEFRLGRGSVIEGWDEGVAGMRPGGRRRLAVPPELGYGAEGKDPVPPDATLIFEIELLEVRD